MKKSLRISLLLVSFVTASMMAFLDRASGSMVVDQAFVPTGMYVEYRTTSLQDVAQTFTAGLSGRLSGIDLFISKSNSSTGYQYGLRVDIRPVESNGEPVYADTSALGTENLGAAEIPYTPNGGSWVNVAFGSSIVNVIQGTQYAIVIVPNNPDRVEAGPYPFSWYGGMGTIYDGPYSGGMAYRRDVINYPGTWLQYENQSKDALGFRTYVQTNPVPIPASLLLLAPGLVGLVRLRRKLTR